MPAKIVVDVVVVPVVLPQLGVLGVLGRRVPVVLRELLKFIILLVDLVVGLALLRGLRVLRGSEGWESVRASMSRRACVGARASVFAPLCTAGFFASVLAASALGLSLMVSYAVVLCLDRCFDQLASFWRQRRQSAKSWPECVGGKIYTSSAAIACAK